MSGYSRRRSSRGCGSVPCRVPGRYVARYRADPEGQRAYIPALDFTFEVLEYLRGSGDSTLVGRAYGRTEHEPWGEPATEAEAIGIATSTLMAFRDSRWDDREAIVFLRGPITEGEPYLLGELSTDQHKKLDRTLVSKTTVADDWYQSWLPDASSGGGASGVTRDSRGVKTTKEQRFLLEDPAATSTASSGGAARSGPRGIMSDVASSTVPTISKSGLKAQIALIEQEVAGHTGAPSDVVRHCLHAKRWNARWANSRKAAGIYLWSLGLPGGLWAAERDPDRRPSAQAHRAREHQARVHRQGLVHRRRRPPIQGGLRSPVHGPSASSG